MKPIIWLINHYAIPPQRRGGTRHYGLAHYLQQQGLEPVIIAANYCHFQQQYFNQPFASTQQADKSSGIPFVWVATKPAYKNNGLKRLLNMFSFAANLLRKKSLPPQKPALILASSPHLFGALAAYYLAKRYKVPFIVEIRDIWPETLVADGKISAKHPLILIMAMIEKFLYKKADKIIAVMDGFPHYVAKKYGATIAAKCNVLPNFVMDEAVQPLTPSLSSSPPPFIFMYAGSHGYANGLDIVLEAAQLLEAKQLPIEIHLVGSGPEKENLRTRAKELQLTHLKFFDAVPKTAMGATLATADAYLMPLRDNPVFQWGISPNKLFDYFAMTKPVLAAVNTALNPVQLANAGIALAHLNPLSLSEAMQQMYEATPVQRQHWGENAWYYLQQYHTQTAVGKKLKTLIANLLTTDNA